MTHETIMAGELRPELRECRQHGRPTTFVIVGRDRAHSACETAGCRRDAEDAHRMESGAGYVPTRRVTVLPDVGAVRVGGATVAVSGRGRVRL